MFGKWYICLFVWVSAVPAAVEGDQLFVPSASYETIQSAIESAIPGDEVVVAPGHYTENLNFRGNAITVRSEDPEDPDVVAATVIDGSAPVDPNFGSVVIFNSGEGHDSVLEGFTITGGTGSWIKVSWEYKGEYWNRCGGGVLCYNMSQPTITRNVFRDNLAGQGGGIYMYGNPVNPADPSNPPVHVTPVITDNEFTNNSAIVAHGFVPPSDDPNNDHGDGGAIVGFQGCDAIITGNEIYSNHAYAYGGGIHLRQWSHGTVENNTIMNNDSALGGGIHSTYMSSPKITRNQIKYNTVGSFGGGGIYVYYFSNPIIEYNIIQHNTSGRGAGIGVYWDSKPTISHNLITDNYTGAGILCVGSSPDIIHNTIANNTAGIYSGGIHCEYEASPLIEHNIISSNSNGYGIYVFESSPPSVPIVRYNNVWNHPHGNYGPVITDQTGQDGNISVDPDYVDSAHQNYHLSVSSSCINAGDPDHIVSPDETDFDGDTRIMGQYIDLGADEAWPIWNITQGSRYTVIQEAMDDSEYGDTVVVGQGHYYENINFGSHQLTLRSGDPNDWEVVERTIIDANDVGTVVVIAGGQGPETVLAGLTITGGNATNGHAGGIWCYTSSLITRNIITGNYASYKGGGLYFWSSSARALVSDNRIINNTARYGGGVFCDSSSRPRLESNYIGYNIAIENVGGIAMAKNSTDAIVLGNTIVGNYAANSGGGISLSNQSKAQVWNNLILGNRAGNYGGAMKILYCDPNVINNTIIGNEAPQGGGVYIAGFTNSLIANNIVAFGAQGEGIYGDDDPQEPASAILLHNDVFGNDDGNYGGSLADQTGLNGNISYDPNFVDPGYWDEQGTPSDPNDDIYVMGNYHLTSGSVCINAGDTSMVPAELIQDMDGEERVMAGGIDIGADEIDPTPHPADLDQNGIVDVRDLLLFCEQWLLEGLDLTADFDNSHTVDLVDWITFSADWFWQAYWYQP